MAPLSGAWTPERILTRVDFPEPFSPTMQCTSPARSSIEQERSAWVGPNAFARSMTRSATDPVVACSRAGCSVLMGTPADTPLTLSSELDHEYEF
jgi:hypothetical protein